MSDYQKDPAIYAKLKAVVAGGKGYGISHSWEGTVLTVTSDSGTSSADLVGPAGDFGRLTEEEKQEFLESAKDCMGADLFVAEITLTDDVYTADKTFAEIKAAIDAGQVVVCDFVGADSKTRCPLTTFTEYSAAFILQSVLGADEYFYITAEGITHFVEDSSDGEATAADIGVFVVTFHQTDGTWLATKTAEEIKQAVADLDDIVCEYWISDTVCLRGQLETHSEDGLVFYAHDGTETHQWIMDTASGAIVHTVLKYPTLTETADTNTGMPVSVAAVLADDTVTVTATYGSGSTSVTTIVLDENGYPTAVSKDGEDCTLTWEGFA